MQVAEGDRKFLPIRERPDFFIHPISGKDFQNYFIKLIADDFLFVIRVSEKEKYFFQKKSKFSVTFFQGSSLKDK